MAKQKILNNKRETNYFKARSYIDAGIYSEAIKLLKTLHEEEPEILYYSQPLANCYIHTKQVTKARQVLQIIRQQHKQNSISLLFLEARVLLLENKPVQAKTYIDKAFQLKSDAPQLYLHEGRIELLLGAMDASPLAFKKEIEIDTKNHHSDQDPSILNFKKKKD